MSASQNSRPSELGVSELPSVVQHVSARVPPHVMAGERSSEMLDDENGCSNTRASSAAGPGGCAQSCTLILRLNSGVELEYDLDPHWFVQHLTGSAT